jgi:spermidine synthase
VTWFDETLYRELGYAQRFRIKQELCRETTPFQELIILDTAAFGRVLVLDGVIQTTERDEFAYHEMLTHVPLFAHGEARRVLIIGGGDGGILREVLRHPVERAVMVEIDQAVVDRCRELMPSLSAGAFDDPRADVRIDDGIRYVAEAQEPFDAIVVDSTDPAGPGEVLFTEAFYADCSRLLGAHGVLVTQCGVPFYQASEVTNSFGRLRRQFADVTFYTVAAPCYVGGLMTLGWAANDPTLRQVAEAELTRRFAARGLATRYYTPAVHRAAFALPPYIAELVGDPAAEG